MSGARIVPMGGEHLDALTKIDALCFSDPWTREGLRAELFSDTARFAAAECGGETVGCAGMHCVCGECYIDKVCVHPGFRRRGIARALVRYLIEDAVKNHAEFITLEVRRSNDAAVALYAGLGFEPVGVRKDFYTSPKEDALLMTRFFQNKG
ncbi:ribosomal protein S18-alanine N-acetyltransferase [Caproiciproducens sp. R2]|uniref:ribosomal protein S18-alanine N-acetyltransferase n=1 Tax=Caproiciproducens sp. R2 TaxID=3435187 RepID=UPI0040344135